MRHALPVAPVGQLHDASVHLRRPTHCTRGASMAAAAIMAATNRRVRHGAAMLKCTMRRLTRAAAAVRVVDLPRAARPSLTPPSLPLMAAPWRRMATRAAKDGALRQRARRAARQTALTATLTSPPRTKQLSSRNHGAECSSATSSSSACAKPTTFTAQPRPRAPVKFELSCSSASTVCGRTEHRAHARAATPSYTCTTTVTG